MGTQRRDSFCGLLSIGDVLRQIGVKYTVARRPICYPADASFAADLDWFVRVCRVVTGVRGARYGQIGARPDAFWTCRYSEKQLQRLGATSVVLDLSEAIAGASALADDDPDVQKLVEATGQYADVSGVKPESVVRSAKFELFLRRFQADNGIDAFGVQCWTSIQANYGVCSCTAMSRLGDEGVPCACESDILGTLSMHAAMLASSSPAGLADWNNLHNEDDELANIWHCGVFPASFAKSRPKLGVQEIIASQRRGQLRRFAGDGRVRGQALAADAVPRDPGPRRRMARRDGRGPFRGQPGGDLRRLRLVPHPEPPAALPRSAAAAVPAPRGDHRGARRQRAVGGVRQLPGHERVSCRAGNAGALHVAAAFLNDSNPRRKTCLAKRRWTHARPFVAARFGDAQCDPCRVGTSHGDGAGGDGAGRDGVSTCPAAAEPGQAATAAAAGEENRLELLDWGVIAFYFAILFGLAWWVILRNKDTADDYFLAGRNLGWFIVGGVDLLLEHRLGAPGGPGRLGLHRRRGHGPLRAARLVPAGAGLGVRAVLRPVAWSSPCPSSSKSGSRPPPAGCSRSSRWWPTW